MSGRYAAGTDVPVDRSKAELERLLVRYGASAFAYAWEADKVAIGFGMGARKYRFRLPLPHPDDFALTEKGRRRPAEDVRTAYEREVRRRWRGLVLIIKAKLEAIEIGVTTLEDEFLSSVILPNGQTVIEHLSPQLALAYRTNTMP